MIKKITTIDLECQQLLSAYLDGELGVAESAVVEAMLRDNSHSAELVESWRQNGDSLRALPKSQLDAGFAQRVLQKIDQTVAPQSISGVESKTSGDALAARTGGLAVQ